MSLITRKATEDESNILTDISFASKRYWNYPEEYFEIWKDELTITSSYIHSNTVYLAENDEQVVGYFSLVEVKDDFWAGKIFINKGFWLEHIFILPEFIGQSIGTELIRVLISKCKGMKISKVRIFSDPNAKGFYDKIGALYLGDSLSSIPGRTVALYELAI